MMQGPLVDVQAAGPGQIRPGESRKLTEGEVRLARSIFGDAIDYDRVRIFRKKYFPLQPRRRTMAPNGNIYFHPRSSAYRDDFSAAETYLQGLFVHEMTHVWQDQAGTNVRKAVFNRRYRYRLEGGKPFKGYGLEQQCEIVRDYFMACSQREPESGLEMYEEILPFSDKRNA
jgi:hypothetical protein